MGEGRNSNKFFSKRSSSDHNQNSTKQKIVEPAIEIDPVVVNDDPWSPEEIDRVSRLWDLSDTEKEHLNLLGSRLYDIDHPKNKPADVIRFIKARPRSVDAAEKMFRNMIHWRIVNKVDTILEDYEPPHLIRDYIPGAVLVDYDRAGDPIYAERIGSADTPSMVHRFGSDHLVKHAIWIREKIGRGDWVEEYERRTGRPVKQILVVEDLKGLSSAHLDRHLLAAFQIITRLDQDNYPEVAKTIVNVNAPFIFRLAWSLVKHFFDHNVADKMVFAGPSQTEKVLEKYVDLTVLPKEIVPIGKGRAAPGLPPNFKGGPLPSPDAATAVKYDDRFKETVSESDSSLGSPPRLSSTTDSISDQMSTGGQHSVSSTISHRSVFSSPVAYFQEQERRREQKKQEEIRGIREIAARRLRPRDLRRSQRERLTRLKVAQENRRASEARQEYVESGLKNVSERMTRLLQMHDKTTRRVVMSSLLLLFFVLMHPRLIFYGADRSLDGEEQRAESERVSVPLSFGLVLYTIICGIVHFLTCDVAMVYAYNALKIGSKTGATIKNYYNTKVRFLVASISCGIFALGLGKALFRVFLNMIFTFIFGSPATPLEVTESAMKTVAGAVGFKEIHCLRREDDRIPPNGSAHCAGREEYISRFMELDFTDHIDSSWQSDLFYTTKILYSYTAVFLLVFLALFNYLTANWALREMNHVASKGSTAVGPKTDSSLVVAQNNSNADVKQPNTSTPNVTETPYRMKGPFSSKDETSAVSGLSLSSLSKRRKTRRLGLLRRKRSDGQLSVVNE